MRSRMVDTWVLPSAATDNIPLAHVFNELTSRGYWLRQPTPISIRARVGSADARSPASSSPLVCRACRRSDNESAQFRREFEAVIETLE